MSNNLIFIQISSYRDPELPKTIKDCIDNAKRPENLRFSIVHQYDETEDLSLYEKDDRFKFIKIPHMQSRGVCWARAMGHKQYDGEKYMMQLDSHHRFVKDWDAKCIKMIKDLQKAGHKKPLLTSYIPSFNPENDPAERQPDPWKMDFDRFIPEGAIFFLPSTIENHKSLKLPIPARFYSAHFVFTLGKHSVEVPYDPNYYFHGEEINMAVRSFTHGYDLFHPHQVIAWHEYTRKGRAKQWDDVKTWGDLNSACHLRNRKLFGMDNEVQDVDFGDLGFGKERTLREYEEYAGICFKRRAVQQYTLDNKIAPNPKVDDFEKSLTNRFKHCIDVSYHDVPEKDYDFWCVAFHDADDNTIYRKDADKNEIRKMMNDPDGYCKIWREFLIEKMPKYWVVWPYSQSKGWCDKITGNL